MTYLPLLGSTPLTGGGVGRLPCFQVCLKIICINPAASIINPIKIINCYRLTKKGALGLGGAAKLATITSQIFRIPRQSMQTNILIYFILFFVASHDKNPKTPAKNDFDIPQQPHFINPQGSTNGCKFYKLFWSTALTRILILP